MATQHRAWLKDTSRLTRCLAPPTGSIPDHVPFYMDLHDFAGLTAADAARIGEVA